MKKGILKTSAVLITAIMLLVTSVSAITTESVAYGNGSDNLLTFEGTLNQEMMAAIPGCGECSSNAIQHTDNSPDFNINLYANSDDTFTGEGYIKLDSGIAYYSATGKIAEYVLDNGDHAFIGTISQETAGAKTLSLTVHSIPTKGKTFVYVNEAIKDQNGVIVNNRPYIFGELFDEMNQFVPLYSEEISNTSEHTEEIDEGIEPYVTTDDYNPKFIKTIISVYPQNGTYYPLIALSAFGPNAMTPFGTHYFFAKVNSNYTQARAYANYLSPGVVIGTSVTGGAISMTAKRKSIGFTKQIPETVSFNVTIPVPIPKGDSIEVKKFSLPYNPITAKMTQEGNYNSDLTMNHAYWRFAANNDIDWSSTVAPKDTTKAYAAQGYLTSSNALSSQSSFVLTFQGSLSYEFTSQYGASQYVGSFAAQASYDHTVILPPM